MGNAAREVTIQSEILVEFSDEEKTEQYIRDIFSKHFYDCNTIDELAAYIGGEFHREFPISYNKMSIDGVGHISSEKINVELNSEGDEVYDEIWKGILGYEEKYGFFYVYMKDLNDVFMPNDIEPFYQKKTTCEKD